MALAQAELEDASKSSENPHFKSKYADLAEVLQTIRPVLSRHGLSLVQLPGSYIAEPPARVSVTTVLLHKSGEYLGETLSVPVSKPDAQGVGAAITYARRYGAAAVCGISQDDDDGETAVGRGKAKGKASTSSAEPRSASTAAVAPPPATDRAKAVIDAAAKATEAELKALAKDFAALDPTEQAACIPAIRAARERLGLK